MAVISVDAGTTMIKAVGYNNEGTEVVVVRQATTVSRPRPGWAEQDMVAVWDAVVYSVRSVTHQLGEPRRLRGHHRAGRRQLAGRRRGRADRPGDPVERRPGRRRSSTDWTRDGVLDQAFRINGSLSSSGLPNAILAWLQRVQPRTARTVDRITDLRWVDLLPDDRGRGHRRIRRVRAVPGHPDPPVLPGAARPVRAVLGGAAAARRAGRRPAGRRTHLGGRR